MGQRREILLGLVFAGALLVGFAPARAAPAEGPQEHSGSAPETDDDDAQEDEARKQVRKAAEESGLAAPDGAPAAPFALSLGAGYAFRPSFLDERNHGGAGLLSVDVPLPWDFAVRVEGGALAWGGSTDQPRPLMRGYAAPSLVYAFDDTEIVALVGVGGFVWAEFEIDDPQPPPILAAGPLVSLVARFHLMPGMRGELGLRLPFVMWRAVAAPADIFPVTVFATAGVTFVPLEWLQ